MGHRERAQLGSAAAQSPSPEPAAHQRGLCVDDLVAAARGVRGEIEEGQEALHAMLPGEQEQEAERCGEQRDEHEMERADPGNEKHGKPRDNDEDGGGIVVLQQDDRGKDAHDDERRDQRR